MDTPDGLNKKDDSEENFHAALSHESEHAKLKDVTNEDVDSLAISELNLDSPEVSIDDLTKESHAASITQNIVSGLHKAVPLIDAYINEPVQHLHSIEQDLSSLIFEIHSLIGIARGSPEDSVIIKQVAEAIANSPEILKPLCSFMTHTFKKTQEGVCQKMVACLLTTEYWIWTLSDESDLFCFVLSEMGMILHFLYQLGELRKNSVHIEAVQELMFNTVGILYNFSTRDQYHKQFLDIEYYKILSPYIYSPLEYLRFAALFAFSHLSNLIPEQENHMLHIEKAEIKGLVHNLKESVDSNAVHLSRMVFTVTEVLKVLVNLTIVRSNSSFLIEGGIVPAIGVLFKSSSTDVRKHSLLLLWKIVGLGSDREIECLLKSFDHLSTEEEAVKTAIELEIAAEFDSIERVVLSMETCYKYKEYAKCSLMYEKIKSCLNDASKLRLKKKAQLTQAKALYHQYKREMQSLNEFRGIKEYRIRHSKCFARAKQVIMILGAALDYEYIDAEGSKYLDMTMIDYIVETNDLKSCKRCLLCRKHSPLRRSHIWPESLLKFFQSGVDSPADHKLWYKIEKDGTVSSWSAHRFTKWMFCGDCETLISKHGETQCIPLIINDIYDVSDPESSTRYHRFHYEHWLYIFCIGLIFRGLASPDPHISFTPFINEDEIYELFLACREAILDLKQMEELPKKFQLAIFFTPNRSQSHEEHSGFINSLLSKFGLFALSDCILSDGSVCQPREAQYFLAHCGVFNILVPLGRSRWIALQTENILLPCDGVLTMPENKDRMNFLPLGLRTFLYLLADCEEVNFLQLPKKFEEIDWIEPLSEIEAVIGHTFALDQDIDRHAGKMTPPWMCSNPKSLTFLPKAFEIKRPFHRSSSVNLPPGHKIIIHHTYTTKTADCSIFIAVGSDKLFPKKQPYLMYHEFLDGVQVSGGFFISPERLTALDLLPDDLEKSLAANITTYNKAKSGELTSTVREMLHEKGFESIHSLLLHSERGNAMDMRCYPSRCWYCKDLCEFCMEPCTVGCEILNPDDGIRHVFCSSCWKSVSPKSKTENDWPVITFLPLLGTMDQEVDLYPGVRDLIALKIAMDTFNHTYISVYVGSEDSPLNKPFVLVRKRNLYDQQCIESFLSKALSPINPLPFDTNYDKIVQLSEDGEIQSLLQEVLPKDIKSAIESCFTL